MLYEVAMMLARASEYKYRAQRYVWWVGMLMWILHVRADYMHHGDLGLSAWFVVLMRSLHIPEVAICTIFALRATLLVA